MTGNPVECVVHPDLWNRSQLWDPLAIGRASLASGRSTDNLEDEYVEESYGAPINTVNTEYSPLFISYFCAFFLPSMYLVNYFYYCVARSSSWKPIACSQSLRRSAQVRSAHVR